MDANINKYWVPTVYTWWLFPCFQSWFCIHVSLTGLNLSDLALSTSFLTALQSQWSLSVPRILSSFLAQGLFTYSFLFLELLFTLLILLHPTAFQQYALNCLCHDTSKFGWNCHCWFIDWFSNLRWNTNIFRVIFGRTVPQPSTNRMPWAILSLVPKAEPQPAVVGL